MPDDDNTDPPRRRRDVDPVRQSDSGSTPDTDEPDPDPEPEPEPEPEQDRPGETIDLSSEVEAKPPRSDVPIKPEVQEAIDEYYQKKEQEEEDQDQDDGDDEQEFSSDDLPERAQPAETSDPARDSDPEGSADPSSDSNPQGSDTESPSPFDTANAELGEPVDAESIDVEELENQDWTLGEARDDKLIRLGGMKFLLSEEDADDEVINAIHKARQGQGNNMSAVYYAAAQIAVKAPEITDERWTNGMTATQRMALGSRCLQYLDGDF